MKTKCFLVICGIILLIGIYFPTRHARHYHYIDTKDIYLELIQDNPQKPNSNSCDYQRTILNSNDIEIRSIYDKQHYLTPLLGGEYVPKNCTPALTTALIVPYRDRQQQLTIFLNFFHNFLQKQNIHYRIFIVRQNDTLPFNRAKMLNYGAKVAMDMGFKCLILHDVDLIPLNTGNIYSCGKKPRHMSSSLDAFRFNLPYLTLFGGAIAITSEQFQRINGMSNVFYGWGGEDDDFYMRLQTHGLLPYRFTPELSKYTMLLHKKENPSEKRFSHLKFAIERHRLDGLCSLGSDYIVNLENLYTCVVAS